METIWRQKRPSVLTPEQRQAKLKKDSEYEFAIQNLSTAFYQKKRSAGVTKKEEKDYQTLKAQLWNRYLQWAISEGLYEEVTPEHQLAEAEDILEFQMAEVNRTRGMLGRKPIKIVEGA